MQRAHSIAILSMLVPALGMSAPAKKRGPSLAAEDLENSTGSSTVGPGSAGPEVVRAQILLDRARFSPGEIDGRYGSALQTAIRGYQEKHGVQSTGVIDTDTWKKLNADRRPLLTTYTITKLDVRGEFKPVPQEIQQQAKMAHLGYESLSEKIGERFHVSPKLLAELNPEKTLRNPGERIRVPNVSRPPLGRAARVAVSKSKRIVTAFDASNRLIAQYPATIGGSHDPLPIGSWKITIVQPNPRFYYSPERFWNANPKDSKAVVAPGPNNPAGVVWMGLSKEHYGIHGTPEPANIHHEESYGCIRLTNWDAIDLSRMVRRGTPAILEE